MGEMSSRTLTLKQMRESGIHHVCVASFERKFGDSVEITEEFCLQHSDDFDWIRMSMAFLGRLDVITGLIQKDYEAWIAALQASKDKYESLDHSDGEFGNETKLYWAANMKATKAYRKQFAVAFARAYIGEGETSNDKI